MRRSIGLLLLLATPAQSSPTDGGLTPRARAAYGMLLYLHTYAQAMVRNNVGTSDGCPTDILGVTFGVAKTDPWGSAFLLRCKPGPGASPAIGSPGPDGKPGSTDDLWSDQPPVEAARACRLGCAKLKSCAPGTTAAASREKLCGSACGGLTAEVAFHVDTCAQLARCDAAIDCLASALREAVPGTQCSAFGRAAARALQRPKIAGALTEECERDVVFAHELLCVEASTTATDLSRCLLTVNRNNVEEIAAKGK